MSALDTIAICAGLLSVVLAVLAVAFRLDGIRQKLADIEYQLSRIADRKQP